VPLLPQRWQRFCYDNIMPLRGRGAREEEYAMPSSAPGSSLLPSEVIFLARDQFAPPAGRLNYFRSSGIEIKASVPELAQLSYAAAFLAVEKAGLLSLNLRSKKALLGLRTVDALYADPLPGRADPFPSDCLESRLREAAFDLSAKQQHEIPRIVHGLWSSDSSNPFGDAVGLIQSLMAARGVLATTSSKRLKLFTVVSHSEPPLVVAEAAAQATEVQAMLAGCRTERPEVWKQLLDGIAKGIRKHEKDDSPDFDD